MSIVGMLWQESLSPVWQFFFARDRPFQQKTEHITKHVYKEYLCQKKLGTNEGPKKECLCMCIYIYIYMCQPLQPPCPTQPPSCFGVCGGGGEQKCMYVCMFVYMCMYLYVCVCMCIYVYVIVCMCTYVYVCACMCMYVYVCVCMCMYVYVCVCMCMYVYICVYMCM